MIVFYLTAAASAQAAVAPVANDAVARPLPVQTVTTPPPPIVPPPPAINFARKPVDTTPFVVQVSITANGKSLWQENLRLGGQYPDASYQYTLNQFGEHCDPNSTANSNWSGRDELRFKMSKAYSANSGDAFSVSMNWTHPTEDCTANGTSQIGLTRVVELGRGKSARIEGDGGVVIDLKRLP